MVGTIHLRGCVCRRHTPAYGWLVWSPMDGGHLYEAQKWSGQLGGSRFVRRRGPKRAETVNISPFAWSNVMQPNGKVLDLIAKLRDRSSVLTVLAQLRYNTNRWVFAFSYLEEDLFWWQSECYRRSPGGSRNCEQRPGCLSNPWPSLPV